MLRLLDPGKQGRPDTKAGQKVLEELAGKKPPRIRCPKCGWQPRKEDRWMCREGCRHLWNTFDTHGVCPACHYQWRDTMCLGCQRWSPHEDWYEKPEERPS